jgi:hypothetical protein
MHYSNHELRTRNVENPDVMQDLGGIAGPSPRRCAQRP